MFEAVEALVAELQRCVNDVAPNEAGTARHPDLHGNAPISHAERRRNARRRRLGCTADAQRQARGDMPLERDVMRPEAG